MIYLSKISTSLTITLLEDTWRGMTEIRMRVEREAGALRLLLNAGKTKLLIVGDMTDKENITA